MLEEYKLTYSNQTCTGVFEFGCRYPIVSMGVLRWLEHTLTDPTFFEEAAESSSLFLVLLDEVIIYTVWAQ